jgi:hypothetical protein
MYEIVLAKKHKLTSVDSVFTFSSSNFPWLAVMLTQPKDKAVNCYGGKNPFSAEEINNFKNIGCNFVFHSNANAYPGKGGEIKISQNMQAIGSSDYDGVIADGVLYINNTNKI